MSCYGPGVNYFGHASVAGWYHTGAALGGVALGAMLPDFANMIGARVPAPADPEVAAGVALHHRTDAAFHLLPIFVGLGRELGARLAAAGCGRGPARATAHIGVELLLDGVIVDDPDARAAYAAGVAHQATALGWHEPGDAERFALLRARLVHHGVPDDLRSPESVAARLLRAIGHRPLLRPSADDAAIIRRELAGFARRVAVAAPGLLAALRATLDGTPTPEDRSGT